jgi:DNA-binding LacI/PurR family transcriptional regulator
LAELRQISLTSVNPDSAGMGELAARCLLERVASPDRPGVERLVAPRLVVRASSAQPPPRSTGWLGLSPPDPRPREADR